MDTQELYHREGGVLVDAKLEELVILDTIVGFIYLMCEKEDMEYGTGKPSQG